MITVVASLPRCLGFGLERASYGVMKMKDDYAMLTELQVQCYEDVIPDAVGLMRACLGTWLPVRGDWKGRRPLGMVVESLDQVIKNTIHPLFLPH